MTVTSRKPPTQTETGHPADLEPGLLVECDSCQTNITHSVHIRCAAEECKINNIDMCPTCFCKGKEVGKHKAWHPYRVIERHSYPIFTEEWGADEELLLIDGLLASGMGSWADAAEHVGTRTKYEAEKHYNEVYVNSPDWPRPKMDCEFKISVDEFQQRRKKRLEDMNKAPTELPPVATKPLVSAPTNHEVAGFMPGRLEFEHEVDNDAEESIKDMEFGIVMDFGGAEQPGDENDPDPLSSVKKADEDAEGEDDTDEKPQTNGKVKKETEDGDDPIPIPQLETPSSQLLKLSLLDIYNSRVEKRLETKAFVFDRGLLEFKKLQAIDRKRSKEERDFINKHKPFAKLQTAEDFDTFIDGLLYEMALRKRIQELQEYRRMGITSLAEADKYEKEKTARLNFRAMPGRDSNGDAPSRVGRKSGPLTFATSSSLHLLTPEEQTLCSNIRVLPKPYLAIKHNLITESVKREGKMRRKDAKDLFKIDQGKIFKIYDFLNEAGLLFKPKNAALPNGTGMEGVVPTGPAASISQSRNTPSPQKPSHELQFGGAATTNGVVPLAVPSFS
ncbi:Transcriptional adapter ada2 [Tulasnella sp. 418]|nr:Transcriptional adapter ada2 [Tulasnella sp. 418]